MQIHPFHEFDWHISSTRRILITLAEVLTDIDLELDAAQEQHQIDDALDMAENVLGLAFVAAQAYITGTIGMWTRMPQLAQSVNKHDSVKSFGEPLSGSPVTDIQLVDAAANYYKHHDEWHDYAKPGPHTRTVRILQEAGIDITDPYPCVQTGEILFSPSSPEYLGRLLLMLTRWRERQIAAIGKSSSKAEG